MMIKKAIIYIFLLGIAATVFLIFQEYRINDLESLIPKKNCSKSEYYDDGRKDRIYIKCRDNYGFEYLVIARPLKNRSAIDNIYSNLKGGKKIKDFICSEFKNPNGANSSNRILSLHTCLSLRRSLVITATNEDALIFFIDQY